LREGDFVTETNVLNHPIYSGRSKMILYAAAAFSLIAALIHLWVIPEHLEEWWGYGAFFLVSAVAQGAYSAALLHWPRRPLLLLGIGGNVSIIVLYLLTRTVGIPFFGPHAGEVEGVGVADLFATTSELALVVALLWVLLRCLPRERVVVLLFVMALVGLFVGHLLHLMLSMTSAH
jgi:manganese oxidase